MEGIKGYISIREASYVYEKQKGKIIVNYVDEYGNVIATQEILIDDIGEDYSAIQKAISGYEFLRMQEGSAPAIGEFDLEQQVVTFVYKKAAGPVDPGPTPSTPPATPTDPVDPEPTPSNTPCSPEVPKTGEGIGPVGQSLVFEFIQNP